MPLHAAPLAPLVPVRSFTARIVEVSRQAAVVAVLVGTSIGPVAWVATKEAGRQLLHRKHTHTHTAVLHTGTRERV